MCLPRERKHRIAERAQRQQQLSMQVSAISWNKTRETVSCVSERAVWPKGEQLIVNVDQTRFC